MYIDQSYEFCGWGFLVSFLACNVTHHVDRAKQLVRVFTILFIINGIVTKLRCKKYFCSHILSTANDALTTQMWPCITKHS